MKTEPTPIWIISSQQKTRSVLFIGVTVVLFLGVLEIISRGYEWIKPKPEDIAQQHALTYNYPPREYRPYTNIYNKPNIRSLNLNTNSLGFRGKRELTPQKLAKVRRVFILGGSTAVGFDATNDQTTISEQLEILFHTAYPSLDIEVYNAACTAFNSSQELVLLTLDIFQYDPDLIIVIDGRNDLYFSTLLQWKPHYTTDIDPIVAAAKGLETGLDPTPPFFDDLSSFIQRHSAFARVIAQTSQLLRHPSFVRSLKKKPEAVFRPEAVVLYLHNVRNMAYLCQANHVPLLVILQPSLTITSKRLTPKEQRALEAIENNPQYPSNFVRVMRQLYPLAKQELNREFELFREVYYLDASDEFSSSSEDMFGDEVHFTDRGNAYMAQTIANFVINQARLFN